jgi:hypothetical protein
MADIKTPTHTDSRDGSKQTPTGPNSGFPTGTRAPGSLGGGTDGKGGK